MFLPFLVQTVMIRTIGIEYIGIGGLFGSILTVLSLAELGVGNAIVYSMYKPIANNDNETICALLNLYRKIYNWIGFVILVLGLLIAPFLTYIISDEYPKEINIYIIYILFLIKTVLSYWLYAYKTCLLNAFQRSDVISKVSTLTIALTNITQIVLLVNGGNYYGYMVLSIVFIVVNNVLISKNVDRLYPEYRCSGTVGKDVINELKKKVGGLVIIKVCYTTRNAFDNIFVSMFLGLTVTAMYSNYYYVMSSVTGLLLVISPSLQAGVGNSIELDSVDKNYCDMQRIDYIYMILSGWCTVCLICLYQPFMKIWVGETYMFPMGVVCLFSIYFYVLKMGDIKGMYAEAAGLFWENRYRAMIEAVMNIILNYILVVKFGVYGIITATIITVLLVNFVGSTLILFKNYFKFGRKQYFLNHLKYFIITTCVTGITYWCCSLINGNDFIVLIVRGTICCIVAPILYLLFYGRTHQFKESIGWLADCLGLKKYA